MAQYDFGTINTATTNGADLATLLENWESAVHSTHKGAAAPSYKQAGMLWIDNASDVEASGTITVASYAGLTGDTITVGTSTITEGVDFTAETSNDVTATNIAAAIDSLDGYTATSLAAVVTVTAIGLAHLGNSLALTTTAGADLTLSGAVLSGGETNWNIKFYTGSVWVSIGLIEAGVFFNPDIEALAGLVGTKEVDETAIADGFTLIYDSVSDKIIYVDPATL